MTNFFLHGSTLEIIPGRSKNFSLPLLYLAASVPGFRVNNHVLKLESLDVQSTIDALSEIGLLSVEEHSVKNSVPEYLPTVSKLQNKNIFETRYSLLLASVLSAHQNEFSIPLPGGCEIGSGRPFDFHLKLFREAGYQVEEVDGILSFVKPDQISNVMFTLPKPSVGCTLQAMILSFVSGSEIELRNPALEPEVREFANSASAFGLDVKDFSRSRLLLHAQRTSCAESSSSGKSYGVDRIEIGTYMIAALLFRRNANIFTNGPDELSSLFGILDCLDVRFIVKDAWIFIAGEELRAASIEICAESFPGLPTDLIPLLSAFLATVPGKHAITDTVYADRFNYIDNFRLMGVQIAKSSRESIEIHGGKKISWQPFRYNDIRSAAADAMLGFYLTGSMSLHNKRQISRGYSAFYDELAKFG